MVGAKFPLSALLHPALLSLFTSAETVDGDWGETLIFTGDFYLPTKLEQLSESGRQTRLAHHSLQLPC